MALMTGSCAERAPAPAPVPPTSRPAVRLHRFSNNWASGVKGDDRLAGLVTCTPSGPELSLRGIIKVRPFGKGTDGAILKTGSGDWVLTYRAEGVLLELQEKEVLVHGRACAKEGESIGGNHFDLATLEESRP